jgi:antitoxin MazE
MDIIEDLMQVSKWGNSLAVRLPKALVEELGLEPGDEIDIVSATKRRIEVEKNDRRERAVARMKARNWRLPEGYRFDRDEANAR